MKTDEHKGIPKISFYLFILIVSVIGLYIWQNLNPDSIKVNNSQVAGEQTANSASDGANEGETGNNQGNTGENNNENNGENMQKVLLFIDKNRNNAKDSNEE